LLKNCEGLRRDRIGSRWGDGKIAFLPDGRSATHSVGPRPRQESNLEPSTTRCSRALASEWPPAITGRTSDRLGQNLDPLGEHALTKGRVAEDESRAAIAGHAIRRQPVVGAGRPSDLLFGAAPAVGFDLSDTTTLSNGIVILSYKTDKPLPRAA
jgi:hypothetical protein